MAVSSFKKCDITLNQDGSENDQVNIRGIENYENSVWILMTILPMSLPTIVTMAKKKKERKVEFVEGDEENDKEEETEAK